MFDVNPISSEVLGSPSLTMVIVPGGPEPVPDPDPGTVTVEQLELLARSGSAGVVGLWPCACVRRKSARSPQPAAWTSCAPTNAAGARPSRSLCAGRRNPDVQSFARATYDQVQPDRGLTDSFRAPSNTASGLFLLRLKPVGDNQSDTLAIGDLTAMTRAGSRGERFGSKIADLALAPGWSREGEYYFAEFESIGLQGAAADGRLVPTMTLLDFIRAGGAEGWVDYTVQDDTSVDFAGIALCREPARGKGLTIAKAAQQVQHMPGVVSLTCFFGGQNEPMCDPYVGDTACSSQLPVACIRPDGKPVPKALAGQHAGMTWSGGQLAFTEPVEGSRFAPARHVDSFCAAQFGTGWRTARFHDGSGNFGIAGRSASAGPQSRVWVDIADSPYATCWAR